MATQTREAQSSLPRRRPFFSEWAILLLATALGAALRLYAVGALPPGLYQDEAYNGLDALDVLQGAHPVYFTANNGREPFYIYLTALSVGALGRTPAAVRLPAAFVGILTVPATYALGRALFGPRAGRLAAAVCAITFWPVVLSRIGLRAGTLPLLTGLSLACAALGWRGRRLRLLALAGALYGLSCYTYLAARFTPIALSIFFFFFYIATRRSVAGQGICRRGLVSLAAFGLPALAVAAPLAWYAAGHPSILLGRADQVSILNPAVNGGNLAGTLFYNLLAALGMFVWRGDTIARHNLPGRPVFDPLLGLAFVAGVLICLRRAFGRERQRGAALALIWTAVMLAPSVLAEDAPHFLRAVGVLPLAFLFPAVALAKVWDWRRKIAGRLLVAAALFAGLGITVRDYFGRYVGDPNTGYLFQSAATDLAREANDMTGVGWTGGLAEVASSAPPGRAYVDRRLWDNFPSLRFLIPSGDRLNLLDAGQPPAFLPDESAAVFLWPYEDPRPVLRNFPAETVVTPLVGPQARGDLEPAPYSLYSEYRLRPLPPELISNLAPWAEFEGGLEVHGQADVRDSEVTLSFAWRAQEPPRTDYQVFVHALAQGEIVAQADGPLGMGVYPGSVWRPGQVVEETRQLQLPTGLQPENVTIEVGLYDPATNVRLQRADAPGDSLEIEPKEQPGI